MIWWIEQIDWMIFVYWQCWNGFWFELQSTLYLWHLNAGGPLQLQLAAFLGKIPFEKKLKMIKTDPKIGFFHYFENFFYWFLLEMTFKMILLSILLYKSHVWENCCSWVGCRIAGFFDHLCLLMKWLYHTDFLHVGRQPEKWKKNSAKFLIGCGQACPRLHTVRGSAQASQE